MPTKVLLSNIYAVELVSSCPIRESKSAAATYCLSGSDSKLHCFAVHFVEKSHKQRSVWIPRALVFGHPDPKTCQEWAQCIQNFLKLDDVNKAALGGLELVHTTGINLCNRKNPPGNPWSSCRSYFRFCCIWQSLYEEKSFRTWISFLTAKLSMGMKVGRCLCFTQEKEIFQYKNWKLQPITSFWNDLVSVDHF